MDASPQGSKGQEAAGQDAVRKLHRLNRKSIFKHSFIDKSTVKWLIFNTFLCSIYSFLFYSCFLLSAKDVIISIIRWASVTRLKRIDNKSETVADKHLR